MIFERKYIIEGCFSVLGAILLHFTFGHFYTVANMVPYIMGYVKTRVDKEIKDNRAIWFSALALGIQGVSMPLGGVVSKKLGYRVVVVTGCLLESLGVIISYFTIQSSFVGVLITYSLIKGAGISFGYSVVIAVAAAWFPARRGLVVGLIVGGFGLGPLIFAPIQKAFINPENVKVNEETKQFTDDKLDFDCRTDYCKNKDK
ncbi:hypothetical protein EG68_01502 [Paragonimus skrjabini miyazakii]|uniref:Major facilitator superfamily (MFS) profile domain-containing protein n=1 Tax=Paragonimus skrjabini miyazakii TaxID=59628 RepID=A0A8S9Z0P6_9TREM|nr:hypothetical protein EG68_01502 [Paragonimus skrjabini miyazakii]